MRLAIHCGTITLCVALVACSAPDSPSRPDGAAERPACGNGRIDQDTNGISENCDDGAVNGTDASLCTKQCVSGALTPFAAEREIAFATALTYTVEVHFRDESHFGVAAMTDTPNEVLLLKTVGSIDEPVTTPNVQRLARPGEVLALGALVAANTSGMLPTWVERGANDKLRLFTADWVGGGEPVVTELPYPFLSDGTSPRLITPAHDYGLTLLDEGPTDDLRVASLRLDNQGHLRVTTASFAGAGSVMGQVVDADQATGIPIQPVQRLVQFFDDTSAFVAIEIRANGSIAETSRGVWPYRVVAGEMWFGLWHLSDELRWPPPFAILDDAGRIWLWQFERSPEPEELLVPFGQVASGSAALSTYFTPVPGAEVFEPLGPHVILMEGDAANLRTSSLKPQNVPAGKLAHVYTFVDGFDGGDVGYSADNSLFVR